MNVKNTSGQISLENEAIVYSIPEKTVWRIPVADVRVIGEFTTANGPYVDDYFFVFVTADKSSWNCASFYAEGRIKFLGELSQKLGRKLECGLCNSTSVRSRVIWPSNLDGHPLFEFALEKPAEDLLGKIRQIVLPKKISQYTAEVSEAIET